MRELIAANSAVDLSGRRPFSLPLFESHTHSGCLPLHCFPHLVLDCPIAGVIHRLLKKPMGLRFGVLHFFQKPGEFGVVGCQRLALMKSPKICGVWA